MSVWCQDKLELDENEADEQPRSKAKKSKNKGGKGGKGSVAHSFRHSFWLPIIFLFRLVGCCGYLLFLASVGSHSLNGIQ